MGLYITGMEMPKSCISCPFMISRDNDDCILQSEEANESFENWEQMKAGCPLIELPPHGRMIDADAFLARNAYFADRDFINSKYDDTLKDLVDAADTIIPADPEDMKGEKI